MCSVNAVVKKQRPPSDWVSRREVEDRFSGTHLAGQVAVAGDGALVNIGLTRKRAKKSTGSSVSVQDMARRVREWNIHKPPSAKHSAWRWAFKARRL